MLSNNTKEIRLFHLRHLKMCNLVFIKSYFSLKFPDNTREDDKPKEISILNQTEKVFSLASPKSRQGFGRHDVECEFWAYDCLPLLEMSKLKLKWMKINKRNLNNLIPPESSAVENEKTRKKFLCFFSSFL